MSLSSLNLTDEQLDAFIKYQNSYVSSANPASGSKFDSNANITQKTISTAEIETMKPIILQINRRKMVRRIEELYGKDVSKAYLDDIASRRIYVHDETSMKPYCASISMYPFLLDGMTKLGGESLAPNHLLSFCGSFINLVLATSNQFAGAVATVEFLTYFDYFARREFDEKYYVDLSRKDSAIHRGIRNALQHVVYALNQPVTKGDQAVFWNISLFDKHYFEAMFGNFVFPDGTTPSWESVAELQKFFLSWFTEERTKATLTFPVVTAAMLTEGKAPRDIDFAHMLAERMENGASFFIYMSESADSLASCCRLRNEMTSNEFSYSLGAGGVMTGSINVITINLNRIAQVKDANFGDLLNRVYQYQMAYRTLVQDDFNRGILTIYNAGLIDLNKQFLTIGVNGIVEAAEYNGIQAKNTKEYREFCDGLLHEINLSNRQAESIIRSDARFKGMTIRFNTEFVPAENLGVKNAKWDKEDGLVVSRDCYNSYFYAVEDEDISIIDKFALYDKDMVKHLDGGSALHLNLTEHPSAEQWMKIFSIAAEKGVQYWTYNVPSTRCRDCNTRDLRFLKECPSCKSGNVTHATRIIGYLKEVDSFSLARQKEHSVRYYART